MPQKIDEIVYPKRLEDILKDNDLQPVFQNYLNTECRTVEQDMYLFLTNPPRPDELYNKHLRDGAPHPLPQVGKVQEAVEMLARKGDNAGSANWALIAKNMRTKFQQYYQDEIIRKFVRSEIFIAYRDSLAAKRAQAIVYPMATHYGINDIQKFTKLLQMIHIGQLNNIKLAAYELFKTENSDITASHAFQYALAIRAGKDLPAVGSSMEGDANGVAFDVRPGRLKYAYIEKPEDKKVQQAVAALATAFVANDNKSAQTAFKALQKLQPKDSFARNKETNLQAMKKMLKSAKVLP